MATATRRRQRVDVALLALSFVVRAPLQALPLVAGLLPGSNEASALGPSLVAYGVAAPWIAFLLWRHRPRARLAAYVFLAFDSERAVRHAHWLLLVPDLAVLAYLQTPAMRQIYPSMWSRGRRFLGRASGR